MGRDILNICILFAQLERETIQKAGDQTLTIPSVSGDSKWGTRTHTASIPSLSRSTVFMKLVANPEEAEQVKENSSFLDT